MRCKGQAALVVETAMPLGIGQFAPVPFNPVAAQKQKQFSQFLFLDAPTEGCKGGVPLSCRDVTANDRPTVTSEPRAQAQRGRECLIHCSLFGGVSRFVIHGDLPRQ